VRYKRLCASVGLVLNDKTVVSKKLGIFCEKIYSRCGRRKLRALPVIGLRAYNRQCDTAGNLALVRGSTLDDFLSIGFPAERIIRLQRRFYAGVIRECRRKAVDPFMPDGMGGLGLLAPLSRRLPPRSCQVFCLAHNGGIVRPLSDPLETKGLLPRISEVIDTVRWVTQGVPTEVVDWAEFSQALVSYFSWYDAAHGVPHQARPVTLGLLLKRASFQTALASSYRTRLPGFERYPTYQDARHLRLAVPVRGSVESALERIRLIVKADVAVNKTADGQVIARLTTIAGSLLRLPPEEGPDGPLGNPSCEGVRLACAGQELMELVAPPVPGDSLIG
jgi:hypothetical protein